MSNLIGIGLDGVKAPFLSDPITGMFCVMAKGVNELKKKLRKLEAKVDALQLKINARLKAKKKAKS